MNMSEATAQDLSPRPCSMVTGGTLPPNSHTKQTDTVPSNVTDLTPPKNGQSEVQ